MVAVPYEGLGDLTLEVPRRWGVALESIDMNPGGFCIGWMAEPVEYLNAGPLPLPERLASQVTFDSVIDLTGWQFGTDLSPAFRARWGLAEHDLSDEHLCTGRAPLGWFSLR